LVTHCRDSTRNGRSGILCDFKPRSQGFLADLCRHFVFVCASVYVITGVLDRRVPYSYVEDNVRALRAAGAEVTFEPMENADHFLVFVERERVLAKLERWLKTTR
jgi:hypothetical protein